MVFGVPSLEHVCIQFLNGTVDESPVTRKNRILRKERSDGAASLLFASSYALLIVVKLIANPRASSQGILIA